jgi:hypothetical protein
VAVIAVHADGAHRRELPHQTQDLRERSRRTRPLTLTEVKHLPAMVDLLTAARALDLGRTKAYELARRGQFPCRVLRFGDTYRVPTAALLELLDIPMTTLQEAEGAGPT